MARTTRQAGRLGAQGVELGLHEVQATEEVHELRPRELRAQVPLRVRRGRAGGGGGGGGGLAEAEAEEGEGLGGAGEVAAGHADVGGPVDRLEQRRAAEGRASQLAAGRGVSGRLDEAVHEARSLT